MDSGIEKEKGVYQIALKKNKKKGKACKKSNQRTSKKNK